MGASRFVLVLGCTASGKSALGIELARRLDGEILSVDSMAVYRGMDVGTAKPAPDIRSAVPHHVLDVVDPWEDYSVARYVASAERAIGDMTRRGKTIVAVGGTALYIKALSEGLFDGPGADEEVRERLRREARRDGWPALHARLRAVDGESAARIHVNDRRRIVRALEVYELTGQPISALQRQWGRDALDRDWVFLGIRRPTEDVSRRINARVRWMVAHGLVDETRALLALDRPLSTSARQALGYAEMIEHLEHGVPLDEAVENIKIHTRRFAKAQRTWFKRFRRTRWLDADEHATATALADRASEHL